GRFTLLPVFTLQYRVVEVCQQSGFCSNFVLATYQAAAKNIKVPLSGALAADAECTSVRTLEHFLKEDIDSFAFKGNIRID
ncbi:hypothetical protein, partial [Yersinia enterocolitica]